jgi:adenylate cyclase
MRICSRAVEIDPHYADAWALLAMAQSSLCYDFGRKVDDGFAAANAALSIDPDIPEARLPIVKRHQQRGNQDNAAVEMEAAISLGPDSWEVNKEAGRFYLFQRDIPAATQHYEKAVELMEGDFHAWAMLSTCYMALDDRAKVKHAAEMMVKESQLAVKEDPSNGAALGILAGGYALLGEEERTREWIDRALLVDPENISMRYNFACVLAAFLGDKNGAIKMLESMIPMASALQVRIAVTDTDLDSLRDDPRFAKMMKDAKRRVGIADADEVTSAAKP